MNEAPESFPGFTVPFIGDDCIDLGEGKRPALEALVRSEFGDLGSLVITADKISLNGKIVLDLSTDSDPDAGQNNPVKVDRAIIAEFDRPSQPLLDSDLIFTCRMIERENRVRIAVHSDLMEAHRVALKQLLKEMAEHSASSYEIDMGRCNEISVTGIGILLLIKENAGVEKDQLLLKNCLRNVYEKLRWAGMDGYFTISRKLASN